MRFLLMFLRASLIPGILLLSGPFAAASATEFLEAPQFSTNDQAASVAIGDFNGDGVLDLAVANRTKNYVSILLGKGNGAFQRHVDYPTGPGPFSIATGDLNNDGVMDLVTANRNNDLGTTVSVLLGNGDGTFGAEVEYQTALDPFFVAVADLNGDGNLDVITADFGFGVDAVSVLLGNGDGTLQTHVEYATNSYPSALAIADVNHDGKPDILTANVDGVGFQTGSVSVLLGNGNGTFQPHVDYDVSYGTESVVIADFDGDGGLDVATSSAGSQAIDVLLGNGDGTFQTGGQYTLPGFDGPVALTTADFNGDGKLDLAAANVEGDTVNLLWGVGDGSFTVGIAYGCGFSPFAIAQGDFNGDLKPDIVTANVSSDSVAILISNGGGSFRGRADYPTGSSPTSIVTADFNHDGKLDLATSNYNDSDVSVLLGKGDGTFAANTDYSTVSAPLTIIAADFNNDHKPDLVTSSYYGGTLSVLLGRGDGTFQTYRTYSASGFGESIVAADFNLDGHLDIAESTGGSSLNVLLGNGDGSFQAPLSPYAGTFTFAVISADFNGDGKPDIAVTDILTDTGLVAVLLGNGDGTFQTPAFYKTPKQPLSLAAGDLNGDGKQDVVVVSNNGFATAVAVVYLGNGDGTLQDGVSYPLSTTHSAVGIADVNGDGKADVVASGALPEVLIGNGDGTLQHSVLYEGGPAGLALGDFNGDSALDFASANGGDSSVSVLLNTGGSFVTLKSVPNPSKQGQPVTFTMQVAASLPGQPVPTGTIMLKDGSTVLATLNLRQGSTKYVTASLSAGTHVISAIYSGNKVFNPNQSAPITQTVTP